MIDISTSWTSSVALPSSRHFAIKRNDGYSQMLCSLSCARSFCSSRSARAHAGLHLQTTGVLRSVSCARACPCLCPARRWSHPARALNPHRRRAETVSPLRARLIKGEEEQVTSETQQAAAGAAQTQVLSGGQGGVAGYGGGSQHGGDKARLQPQSNPFDDLMRM